MIQAQGLTRRYGEFAAVDDVSFQIERGEVVGLLGHNGAGKTTIMKMLTGFIEPSAGQALVGGVVVEANLTAAQRQLGYLPENLPLYPEMLVADYLAYVAKLRGLDPAVSVPAAIAATDLQLKALDSIDTLSRGYKQRVGVAQAILHEPPYLILDEPTNGLDPTQTLQMRKLIRRLAKKSTVILSTHIMQEVDAVCDRALILRAGKLVFDERLDNLASGSRLRLRTSASANLHAQLDGLAEVCSVSSLSEGVFELELQGEINAGTATVAAALIAAGQPLYELAPVKRDLERIFRDANDVTAAETLTDV